MRDGASRLTVASAIAPLARTREAGVTVNSAGWDGQTVSASDAAAGALSTNDADEAAPTTA